MKNRYYLAVLLVSAIATQSSYGMLGKMVGTAKTIHSTYTGIIGKATVTPAYALGYYRKDYTHYYGQSSWTSSKFVERDPVTDEFHYLSSVSYSSGGNLVNYEPFVIPPLERRNFYCNMSYGPNTFIVRDTVDFRIHAWVHSIVKTGYWPTSGPYQTVLKTSATALAQNCNETVSGGQEVRRTFGINEDGITSVAMRLVDYRYNWPMLCWIGEPYQN